MRQVSWFFHSPCGLTEIFCPFCKFLHCQCHKYIKYYHPRWITSDRSFKTNWTDWGIKLKVWVAFDRQTIAITKHIFVILCCDGSESLMINRSCLFMRGMNFVETWGDVQFFTYICYFSNWIGQNFCMRRSLCDETELLSRLTNDLGKVTVIL